VNPQPVYHNVASGSPLGHPYHEARFYLDYRAGGSLTTLKTPLYQPGVKPLKKQRPPAADSPAQEAARLRFERASAKLGPRERALAIHVTVCDLPLAAYRAPVGYGREPPLQVLRRALDALIIHYGWASRLSVSLPMAQQAAA
jgi:hypothetical protein